LAGVVGESQIDVPTCPWRQTVQARPDRG
jgi:hypothetical protein